MVKQEHDMAIYKANLTISEQFDVAISGVAISGPGVAISEPVVGISKPGVAISEPDVGISEPGVAISEPNMAISVWCGNPKLSYVGIFLSDISICLYQSLK